MGFTIPATYPTPLENQGVPNTIRAATLLTLIERDRYVIVNQRRLLCSCGPLMTTSTLGQAGFLLSVHNSALTSNGVQVAVSGFDADVTVTVDAGNTGTLSLGATFDTAYVNFAPNWTDDTWFQVIIQVDATGAPGTLSGVFGVYVFESPLASLP
jgi:hypothetical protein